jgi:hypothetical protein
MGLRPAGEILTGRLGQSGGRIDGNFSCNPPGDERDWFDIDNEIGDKVLIDQRHDQDILNQFKLLTAVPSRRPT